jgi:hypothetical protein
MAPRPFQFFRAGGFDQVHFTSGADLVALEALDPKLWVALACPVKGLAFDARTLELIDTEKDGRIRASELVAAARWVGSVLQDLDLLLKGADGLPLAAISQATDEGRTLAQAAQAMLASLGKSGATALTVGDTLAAAKAFDALPFNGDGVITAQSASADADRALLAEVLASVGSVADRSGQPGVDAALVDRFFSEVKAHAAWLARGQGDPTVSPLKAGTAAALAALTAVRAKVDDYFARCQLAAFDSRATAALNRDEKDFAALAGRELTATSAEVAAFPLARVEAGRPLPLIEGLNPAWAAGVAAFRDAVVQPLLGELTTLTEGQWRALQERFAPYQAWQAAKVGAAVEKLAGPRLEALAQEGARAPLDALLAQEKAQAANAASIQSVEKLVRCARDLYRLATNFVSFREFYQRQTPAVFQVGTLFLDQRACELCLTVEDAGKHASLAPLSRLYLAYCDCVRPIAGEKRSIVAAFTAGHADSLMVGRNGVFVDRDGRDWDATITKVVDNPISIRQAFWSPYTKLLRFVEEQVGKRAAEADQSSNALLTSGATGVAKAAETGKAEPAPKKFDVGVVAALGVAVGGITAALGALLQAFFGLGAWMPLGLLGLVGLISGPSMLIALLKLRQRNIGPLLDANGWAVNANARLNIPFGASLTRVAVKPAGSRVDTRDPFEETRRPWGLYLALAVLLSLGLAWYLGRLDQLLPGPARSTSVLGSLAPAATQKAPEPKAP